jgi:hypothetical protein
LYLWELTFCCSYEAHSGDPLKRTVLQQVRLAGIALALWRVAGGFSTFSTG